MTELIVSLVILGALAGALWASHKRRSKRPPTPPEERCNLCFQPRGNRFTCGRCRGL